MSKVIIVGYAEVFPLICMEIKSFVSEKGGIDLSYRVQYVVTTAGI